MSRFETLPSGERINVEHVERVTVEELHRRFEVQLYMASSRCVRAGIFDTETEAEEFVAALTTGRVSMFDEEAVLSPAEHARAVQVWDAKVAGGRL